ncbi:TRAP transporter small permease [Microbacterium aquimaris]|uniref:TRAP transporter small permease n=1 Tax=Microbacterium aquimaris TaxID=459816 RepID=UPI002AD35091|nr:TRAP transporter small permease [Microbacterium aquimaris]MDZ8275043.1 TRAP transporter small permease [Microbacterium aquimaris]
MSSLSSPPTVGGIATPHRERLARRWARRATLTLEVIAAAMVFMMMVAVLVNVVSRYFLGRPVQGTSEVVGFVLLPAVVFIGYVVAQVRGATIEADIVYQRFPRAIRREVRAFTSFVSALVCLGFAWYGLDEAVHSTQIGRTAPASDVLIAPVYWLVPGAFAVLTVLFVLDAIRAARGRFDHEGLSAASDMEAAE